MTILKADTQKMLNTDSILNMSEVVYKNSFIKLKPFFYMESLSLDFDQILNA